jgi:acyl dehydratase
MPTRYFEDYVKGTVTEYGPRRVTREEIVAFAAEFDPQPMHLDEDAARTSMLGGLAASGWHSCGLVMRMVADGPLHDSTAMGSPGVEEVRWLRPLRPDDRVTLRVTVADTRTSRSRPELGFVAFVFELIGQSGLPITIVTGTMMFGRRQGEISRRPE